jgi:hypothetical protein
MSGRAVVDLLGPVTSLWIAAGATRTLVLGDPMLGPDSEVDPAMMYLDVIAIPERDGPDRNLSVTSHVITWRHPDGRILRNLQYVVQNHNTSSGTFFTRMAILARFAASP